MSPEPSPAPAGPPHLPHRLLFNINFVFLFTLTANTVGFLAVILLARALGPEGRGVLALYQAAVGLGFAFLNLGAGASVFYFTTRQELTPRASLESGLSVSLFATGVCAAAVLVFALAFESLLAERVIPYALAIVAVPALIQMRVTDGVLRAQGRFGAVNALEVALPLSMLASLGAVEVAYGLTVPRAVWAWTLSFLPPLALAYALIGRRDWPRRPGGFAVVKRTTLFGGQSQLTNLIQLLNYRVDSFLILLLVNTAGVGIYSVASSQTEGLWIIANSVAVVLLTNITAGDADNAARLTPVICRNTLLVTAVGAAGAALLASRQCL